MINCFIGESDGVVQGEEPVVKENIRLMDGCSGHQTIDRDKQKLQGTMKTTAKSVRRIRLPQRGRGRGASEVQN